MLLATVMRNGLLSTLFMFFAITSHALEMEYISPTKKAELEQDFARAEFSPEASDKIKQKVWTCDMYGVRTRLQVKRGVKLYNWKQAGWRNDGSQIVRNYSAEDGELRGRHGPLQDEVKINAKGQLISRLSLTHPAPQVVAYAVCDTP